MNALHKNYEELRFYSKQSKSAAAAFRRGVDAAFPVMTAGER